MGFNRKIFYQNVYSSKPYTTDTYQAFEMIFEHIHKSGVHSTIYTKVEYHELLPYHVLCNTKTDNTFISLMINRLSS